MAYGIRLLLCVLFAFVILCSARNTIPYSGNGKELAMDPEGESLKVGIKDYEGPGPNPKHDPRHPPPREDVIGVSDYDAPGANPKHDPRHPPPSEVINV